MKYRCAGIVLYNPDLKRLKDNINAIYNQVEKIIVVDNCSNNINDFENIYNADLKIELIKNEENKGIATALNQLSLSAKNKGYEWMLFLDQDSVCGPNIIDKYEKYINDKDIALMCPYIIDINKMTISEYKKLNLPDTSNLLWAITSGSFVNLDILINLGGFDDYLFIDEVDIEFSKRLEVNGYIQKRINDAYLLQEVGHAEVLKIKRPHKDMAGKVTLKPLYRTNHSAIRKYYMARNGIIVAKKYKNYQSYYLSLCKIIGMNIVRMIIEKNKIETIKSIFKGLIDGLRYKIEPYSN